MHEGGFFFQVMPPDDVLEGRPDGLSVQSAVMVWSTAYSDADSGSGYRLLAREDLRSIYDDGYRAGEEVREVRESLESAAPDALSAESGKAGGSEPGSEPGEDSVFDSCDPDPHLFFAGNAETDTYPRITDYTRGNAPFPQGADILPRLRDASLTGAAVIGGAALLARAALKAAEYARSAH